MEPINWILFAVFIVIVVWKLVRQRRDARSAQDDGKDRPPQRR